MTSYGLQCWDSTGNEVVKVTDRLTRVLFTKEVDAADFNFQILDTPPGTSLVVGNSIDTENTDAPTANGTLFHANDTVAILATPISDGFLDEVTFYGHHDGSSVNVKGVVWDSTSYQVLSVTPELSIDSGTAQWWTIEFIDKPYLVAGSSYYIGLIIESNSVSVHYSLNDRDWMDESGNLYNSPEDLIAPNLNTTNPPCIYGTYTDQYYSGDISHIFAFSQPLSTSEGGISHSVEIYPMSSTTYVVIWYPNDYSPLFESVDSLIVVMGY